MIWYKVTDSDKVAAYIAQQLQALLQADKRVLWLVSGGSAISIAVAVAQKLQTTDASRLIVSLVDERYGEVGHADENWRQLLDAGFSLPSATLQPILKGESPEATTVDFAAFLKQQLAESDVRIGLFGIGADGHTAGVLPHSPAVLEAEFACYYSTETYKRITMTPPAIAALDCAIVYAKGPEKAVTLEALKQTIAITDQPAQILKQVPRCIVFNDHQGESL